MPSQITARLVDHQVVENETRINSSSLATALIHNQDAALEILRKNSDSIKLEDISIDSAGRVVIRNEAFAKSIREKVSKSPGWVASNGTCGAGC